MKVIKRSTVSAWNDFSENTSQSFPGIAVTPSGQIIVSWRNAPQKESLSGQNVFYSISDDGGNSWSTPENVFRAPMLNSCPGTFRTGFPSWVNGKLCMTLCWVDDSIPGRPFFKEENSGLLDCRIFLSESEDNGKTWSQPQFIDSAPFGHLSTPTTGPLLAFSNGEKVLQFELNKTYDSREIWRHLPVLKFSGSEDLIFNRHAIPAEDPENNIFYWDQRPLILQDDAIVNFYWTWDNASNSYRNIHMSYSDDRGSSWTAPADTGLPGQAGQPVEFSNGALLLPLVDRTGIPKIAAGISFDRGRTFQPETLEISSLENKKQTSKQNHVNGAWNEMTKFSLGLPAGIASGHDTAYIVWYEGEDTDRTNIEFAEISL